MPVATLGTAAAVAGGAGSTLFQYNRKNFMYDRSMRAGTEYQIMEMQINKQDMFREDIRDIVELTAVKMDTYTIITVIQMGFCIIALCEGRLGHGTPPWLICAHTLTLCTAFCYLLLSVWIAMHATIAANAYKVRLLTQVVRLPIPSWAQLEGARTYASSYEKVDARQMFRVPFACGKQEAVAKGGCLPSSMTKNTVRAQQHRTSRWEDRQSIGFSDEAFQEDTQGTDHKAIASTDPWGLERSGANIYELDGTLQTDPRKLRHIQLVREAMQYWAASDAFARVCMSIGTQLFAIGLAYYVIGYVLMINHAVIGAWLAVVLILSVAWAVLCIDMSLTTMQYLTSSFLLVISPACVLVSSTLWSMDRGGTAIQILMPIAYIGHVMWLLFLLRTCKAVEQKNGVILPTGYRSVLYIDVFGWIKRNVAGASAVLGSSVATPSQQLAEPEDLVGAGPAVQAIRYENGCPVPMRTEQLRGANRQPRPADISKTEFAPSTFTPGVKAEDSEHEVPDHYVPGTAGRRPWTVFYMTTLAFAFLWLASGVVISLQLCGLTSLKLAPQLEQDSVKAALLDFEGNPDWLGPGDRVATDWPHANVNPIGLACNGASNSMVVSSRYGLYKADFGNATHIKFDLAPLCEELEGEALQDVSLQCGSQTPSAACHANVLYLKGRSIAKCALEGVSAQRSHNSNTSTQDAENHSMSLAGHWLSGRTASGKVRVDALASRQQCSGHKLECTYAGTSDQRVVGMQESVDGQGGRALFPKRVVATKASISGSATGGSMDIISDRYLGLLADNGRRLRVIDLDRGGVVAGLWRLPDHPEGSILIPKGKAWTAMCAAGDSLYLLSKGLSPQLWRFPVPARLRHERLHGVPMSAA